jgi:protein-S-isoprenylcysteine O-methyltransferase Ste14
VGDSRKRHGDREDLTGEHRWGDAGQAAFAVAFGLVWVADSFFLDWTAFANEVVPIWLRLCVGMPLLLAAALVASKTMRTVFGEVRDPPAVIRSGLYARSRHPMYFSEIMLYAGLVSTSLSIAAAAVAAGAVAFLYRICRFEERLLVDRFGEEYRKYMREVPMWIPRLRKGRSAINCV